MSKRALLLLVVVSVCSDVLNAAEPLKQGSSRDRAPTVIPIELLDNRAIVTAAVNGTAVRLTFDLGSSSGLVLQQGTLERIKAVPTGEVSKFQSVEGVFEVPKFKVSRLQIGSLTFEDVVTPQDSPHGGYEPGPSSQGFLGTGLLKSYEVVIDYPQRTMTLVPRAKEGASGSCKGTVVPFDQSPKWRGEPVTKAQTDIGPVILWWDTGAPVSVLRKTLTDAARVQSPEDTLTTNRLTLGNAEFGPWQFQLWDMALPGFDGFLGYDFFEKHVFCVDFPGNRIVVVR